MAERAIVKAEVAAAARRVAGQAGVPAEVLLAVAIVETNAVAYAEFQGRREPLIRFEGHYFDRLLDPQKRARARAAGLANPKVGGVKNPLTQAARWRLLDRAAAIDPAASFASTSWGLGQVMGVHWQRLGFGSPDAMAKEARRSAEGQFAIMAAFLRQNRLEAHLPRGDVAAFARAYNGPAFGRNGYDRKIKAAFAAATRRLAQPD